MSTPKKNKSRTIGVLLIGLLALVLAFCFRHPLYYVGRAITAYAKGAVTTHPPPPQPAIPVPVQMDTICAELKASKDPATTRALLTQLRNLLNSLPPAEASHEVQAFLATNKDAATNLDLTITSGGIVGDTSSMRVFLLDYLGLLDKPAAGAIAAQVLAQYTTPDEWAISLRNYAWAHPDTDGLDLLKSKSRELVTNAEWSKDPTAGYLEAFDTIVYTRDTTLTPQLSAMVRDKNNRATTHAAYLVMDRLILSDPVPMLKDIVEQPDLMKGREQVRADFVARADLGQPDQRALVKAYLLDPARSPQELDTFAKVFPNASYMISNNLLTNEPTPTEQVLIQRDQDALKTVEQWQKDPHFKSLKPELDLMHERLANFVQQAASNKH